MTSNELRQKFLNFFETKGHRVIPSASLLPENDPTVLFTTAGMQPLVPYLLGEDHPEGRRLTSAQKCIRTDDIDEVGDKVHHTFFEMLGNWSLGDYFKRETIDWSYEFLTKSEWLNIDPKKLAISVFAGDEDAPFDKEAYDIWRELGIPEERIAKLPKKNNWWGPAGTTGPCGPDTEMFYWSGEGEAPANFDPEDDRWVEIWNDVFMQYNKTPEGKFTPLLQKNVDTGMGLERALAVLNGLDDNYRTDLFWPIIQKIEEISHKKYEDFTKEMRIIADHIKAAVFAIGDGAVPSNKDRGYVVRRLIRRAVVKGHELGVSENFTTKLAEVVFSIYDGTHFHCHPRAGNAMTRGSNNINSGWIPDQVRNDKERIILSELEKEETKFRQTLRAGLKQLQFLMPYVADHSEPTLAVSGKDLFNLYQSFGFPLELSLEELINNNVPLRDDAIEEFNGELLKHQQLSRTASAGMFKGGLSDSGDMAVKYHTATHLLHAALRKVLGEHVQQKGSNITAERLRFDFSHPEKMTPEQIKEVEGLVNDAIESDLPVTMEEMSPEEAKNSGALGFFEHKYGDKVKVYTIGYPHPNPLPERERESRETPSPRLRGEGGRRPEALTGGGEVFEYFSREICGGPHATHTGELGHLKITKEEASSAGIRRIKAVLE